MQETLMKFDPATGEPRPYPSHAEQWLLYHGFSTAWLFNPWTGSRRGAGDVGTDPLGRAIVPPSESGGEPMRPAIRIDAPGTGAAGTGVDGTDSAKAIAKAASLVGGVIADLPRVIDGRPEVRNVHADHAVRLSMPLPKRAPRAKAKTATKRVR